MQTTSVDQLKDSDVLRDCSSSMINGGILTMKGSASDCTVNFI